MKHLLNLIIAFFLCNSVFAQKAELSVIANGGLFHYTGVSSAKQTFINVGVNSASYTNDVYGNKNGFSYGGALQLKLISQVKLIAGLQGGYDVLRSKVDVVNIGDPRVYYSPSIFIANPYPNVKGQTILSSSFININPFIGYRLVDKRFTLDVLPGIDIALGLSSREKGKATTDNAEFKTNVDRGKPETDFRLRLGVEAGYKQWTLSTSYASGKSNYMRNYVGGSPQAYSSYLRFGIGYRIF